MSAQVDLRQLAVRRSDPSPRAAPGRHLLMRYVLPGMVLLGFAGVLVWAARDSLLPSRPVTVVPVLSTRAEVQPEGTPLFQTAGWVEPRPTPFVLTAQFEGVVKTVHVVEGQDVRKGQLIAELVTESAELAVESAEAELEQREAELARARASLTAARFRLDRPVHLEAELQEAELLLIRSEREQDTLPAELRKTEEMLRAARLDWEGKRQGGFASEVVLAQAASKLEEAKGTLETMKAKQARFPGEVAILKRKRDLAKERLERKTDEVRQLADADADVKKAQAELRKAKAALTAARLRLKYMEIRTPQAGNILQVVARPGLRLGGLNSGASHDSSTVALLYQPDSLQVRADVRLEDVPRVQSGQKVKIETPAAPGGALDGTVLLATAQADVGKNTLQVKVAIDRPPRTLRPDMLVQVTFLAPRLPKSKDASREVLRLLVPRRLVESGEGGAKVWIADQAAGVAQQSVRLGFTAGDLVEVVEGLTLTDRLISGGREGLTEGQRIKITGEDVPNK